MLMKQPSWHEFGRSELAFLVRSRRPIASCHHPGHKQDHAEIIFFESGAGTLSHDGGRFQLCPDNLAFIRPNDRHQISIEKGSVLSFLFFPSETVRFLGDRYFQDGHDFFWGKEKSLSPIALNKREALMVKEWVTRLSGADQTDRLESERFLMNIFSLLSESEKAEEHDGMPAWLRQALADIRNPINARGGTKTFFRLTKRSSRYTAAMLKKHLGITPSEVVNQARMAYVAEQLTATDEAILDIARSAGYKTPSHFYRIFYSHYRMKPFRYRNLNKVRNKDHSDEETGVAPTAQEMVAEESLARD